jgi:outer membrane protein assembly factor BamB
VRFSPTGPRARRATRALALGALLATAAAAPSGCGGDARVASAEAAGGGAVARTWAAPNADLWNTRRVTGPIEARSVHKLRLAWTLPIPALGYAATPVVAGGVAYTQDLQSNVYAIDVASGRPLWKHVYEEVDIGPNGVNVAGGRVFGATQQNAFALDARSGRELWSKHIALHRGDAIDMAPGYKDGTVYISTAVASGGAVGTLWALDGATGRTRWRWQEVPTSLWGHPEINAGGGLWHPPAFDERGALYVGTANPLPFPGTEKAPWGSSRPGDNKWNNAIVKLDARTGRFLWGRQVLPHDLYDWDLECPIILARAGGRRVALAAGKMGIVYAFDAVTGALLWKRPVGLHNGHDHDNLLALHGRYSQLKPSKVLPGSWGGVQTQMASDGATVYVPVNDLYVVYYSQTRSRQQDLMQGTGEVVALDIATGRIRWDRKLSHGVYGAATVSNDLVFTTTVEGVVWALDKATGAVVWRSQLPLTTDAPVAVSGDTLITAASLPLREGEQPQLVAYRLAR